MEGILSGKVDLYGLLELTSDASAQDIKTAYRKKALKVHPDKNPDNPEAAKLFHQLSEAFKLLSDESAKAAYDRVLRAKKVTEIRHQKMDAKRKKLKEDLEAREKAAASQPGQTKSADQLLRSELDRLRKEASQNLAQEQERIRQMILQERLQHQQQRQQAGSGSGRLKVTWKGEPDDGDYTYDRLHRILYKYGDITALIFSSKRKGSALVEFARRCDAELALSIEKGHDSCPLKLAWIKGDESGSGDAAPPAPRPAPAPPTAAAAAAPATTFEEYEAQVMRAVLEAQRARSQPS